MKLAAFLITAVSILSLSSALASGPVCITQANIYGSGLFANAVLLELSVDTAFGPTVLSSETTDRTPEINQGFADVKKIFDENRNAHGGKLEFCFDQTYAKGRLLPRLFTISEFVDLVKTEDALLKRMVEAKPQTASHKVTQRASTPLSDFCTSCGVK